MPSFLISKTSKMLIFLFISNSYVNLTFFWKVLSIIKTWSIDINFIAAMVSLTYHFHGVMYSINCRSSVLSNSTINFQAIIGPKGDLIAAPSHCWYTSFLNVTFTYFVHKSNTFWSFDVGIYFILIINSSKYNINSKI